MTNDSPSWNACAARCAYLVACLMTWHAITAHSRPLRTIHLEWRPPAGTNAAHGYRCYADVVPRYQTNLIATFGPQATNGLIRVSPRAQRYTIYLSAIGAPPASKESKPSNTLVLFVH